MSGVVTRELQVSDLDATRVEWLTRLNDLITLVKGWAEGADWSIRVIEKSMRDSVLGPYKAPALLMQRETVKVLLDPVGRFAPGTEGVVDLYLMPGYDDIARLFYRDGGWTLRYAFRPSHSTAKVNRAESMSLEEASWNRVLNEIAGHAA